MKISFYPKILMGLFLFCALACQSTKQDAVLPQPQDTDKSLQTKTDLPSTKPLQALQSCEDVFAQTLALANPDLKITSTDAKNLFIESEKFYEDIPKFLQSIRSAFDGFFQSPCQKDLLITFKKDVQFFYKGIVRSGDAKSYQQKQISWPEWVRRMNFTAHAALDMIKNRLKAARADQDHNEALTWANHWLQQEPGNVTATLVRANIFLAQKKYAQALLDYDAVLMNDPKNEIALFNRAYTYSVSGQSDLALAALQDLVEHFSESLFRATTLDVLLLHLAQVSLANQDLVRAEDTLQKIRSDRFEVALLWGNLYRAKKDFVLAEQKFLANLGQASSDQRELVFYNLVVNSLDQKDRDKAQGFYNELKTLRPDWAKDFFFLEYSAEENQNATQ